MRSLVVVALAGCVELHPEVGPLVHEPCENIDSDPDTPTSFELDVVPIVTGDGHCDTCHTPEGRTPFGIEVSGLDISTLESLLAGGTLSGSSIVVPGRPCDSVLVQKLGTSPPFGARMPLDGPPYLGAAEVQTLADWIAEGGR